jgi:ferredoxin
MRLRVDGDRCIGAGQCVRLAPDVFDQDEDDGTVVLLRESVPADREAVAREAVNACPAQAIAVDSD